MPCKRHSPESIAKVLRQAGYPDRRARPQGGCPREHCASLEEEIWDARHGRDPRDERAARREHAPQASGRRLDARQGDVAGRSFKNVLKPAKQCELAGEMQGRYGVSERRVSQALRFNRASVQYKPKTSALNEILRARIKQLACTRVR
jgi:hypothetical protein